MKASRSPSPLREFHFDESMRVFGLRSPPKTPVVRLYDKAAAAVRRRRSKLECWVQLHLGFLCEEARRETRRVSTRWQVGRQPGDWAWLEFSDAVRFMGGLEAGQGQPAILSAWGPAWRSVFGPEPSLDVGLVQAEHMPATCWWVDTRDVSQASVVDSPSIPRALLWRLKVRRQQVDTDPRAWLPSSL